MPFVSKSQQKWMFANKPKMAKRWAHHTPDIKSLPDHVSGESKEASMDHMALLGTQAAQSPYLNKLASDTGLSHEEIYSLAELVRIPAVTFCKQAYADPQAFNQLISLVKEAAKDKAHYGSKGYRGGVSSPTQSAPAPAGKGRFESMLGSEMPTVPGPQVKVPEKPIVAPPVSAPRLPTSETRIPGVPLPSSRTSAVINPLLQKLLGKGGIIGKDPKMRALAASITGVGGLLAAGGAKNMLTGGAKPTAAPVEPEITPPAPKTVGLPGTGMSPGMKALLLTGAAGTGAYGLSRLLGKKKRKEAYAMDKRASLATIPGAVLGGLGGAVTSPEGHKSEGLIRGGVQGAGLLGGADIGALIGGKAGHASGKALMAGSKKRPIMAILSALGMPLAGGLAGGRVGWGMGRSLVGEPSWKTKGGSDMGDGFLTRVMTRAALVKIASLQKKELQKHFASYLDKVASYMEPERQHRVRTIQAAVCQGKPLSHAIKMAYPHLNGEQRGLLAAKLVKAAHDHIKRANMGAIPTTEPMTQTGPASQFGTMMNKVAHEKKSNFGAAMSGIGRGLQAQQKPQMAGPMGAAQGAGGGAPPMSVAQQAMQHAAPMKKPGMMGQAAQGLQGMGQRMMGGAQNAMGMMSGAGRGIASGIGGMMGR